MTFQSCFPQSGLFRFIAYKPKRKVDTDGKKRSAISYSDLFMNEAAPWRNYCECGLAY